MRIKFRPHKVHESRKKLLCMEHELERQGEKGNLVLKRVLIS